MENNSNIPLKESNQGKKLTSLNEDEGSKGDISINDGKEQDNNNLTSVSEDGPEDFKDYLIHYKPKKIAESSADQYINQYLPKLKGIIESCKNKNDYTDFTVEDLKVLTDKDVKSALSAYYYYKKDYGCDASDNTTSKKPLQQIFYGAPGTGKSYKIKELTSNVSKENVIRTTFHPDSDYSTFVGAYKPTTQDVPVMTVKDGQAFPVKQGEKEYTESKIVYEFVEQSFLKAYIKAWQNYANAVDGEKLEDVYLVIEEINRGNCAQIFGDLFQLLDRNDKGFSDYEIYADKDMQRHLQKAFKGLNISKAQYENEEVTARVLNGDILLLPNNLHIWATMNTSDQSLFPIDSAFKRRWDWSYVPITNAKKDWEIKANGQKYDWWEFLETINKKIEDVTKSEDKQLGYFFCTPDNGTEISAETFVGKVVFYLWNDVFKDFNYNANSPFKNNEGAFSFRNFYSEDGEGVNEATVLDFLKNLGLESEEEKKQQQNNGSATLATDTTNPDAASPENETTDPAERNNDASGKPTDEE